jgi:hypothetical protein
MLIKVHKPSLNEVGLTNKDKSLEKHKCKIKSKLKGQALVPVICGG